MILWWGIIPSVWLYILRTFGSIMTKSNERNRQSKDKASEVICRLSCRLQLSVFLVKSSRPSFLKLERHKYAPESNITGCNQSPEIGKGKLLSCWPSHTRVVVQDSLRKIPKLEGFTVGCMNCQVGMARINEHFPCIPFVIIVFDPERFSFRWHG